MSKINLFIGAHPDDIEIGCAGTVAKLIAQDENCIFIIATNGEQGSTAYKLDELAKIRKQEAIDAAKELGVSEVHFLELPDGLTKYELDDKIKLISLIRKIRPNRVFIHSSTDHHPDHTKIHQLCVNAINSAGGPWFPKANGEPHRVEEILGYEVWNPINRHQMLIDITPYMDLKIKALNKHQSQVKDFPYLDAIKGLGEYRGALAGGGVAEAFEVIKVNL